MERLSSNQVKGNQVLRAAGGKVGRQLPRACRSGIPTNSCTWESEKATSFPVQTSKCKNGADGPHIQNKRCSEGRLSDAFKFRIVCANLRGSTSKLYQISRQVVVFFSSSA